MEHCTDLTEEQFKSDKMTSSFLLDKPSARTSVDPQTASDEWQESEQV